MPDDGADADQLLRRVGLTKPVSAVTLRHFFPSFRSLGGVETVLQQHHAQDEKWGFNSEFFIYFERPDETIERVHFLGFDGNTTIASARLKVKNSIAGKVSQVAVHHGLWGMNHLADMDGAERRVLILHGHVPRIEDLLRQRARWVDGVLCVSHPLRETVRAAVPRLEQWRTEILPYPISPPLPVEHPPIRNRPLIMGFCGRMIVEQKRIDRLPLLVKLLNERKFSFNFEFLGDGPDAGWLQEQVKHCHHYFHGRKSGEDYWRAIANWDVIVFVSDYEGTPIALLEALSQGVIPVFPAIKSGGDHYTQMVDPGLIYEAGDLATLAQRIEWIASRNEAEITELRRRCRDAVSEHTANGYMKKFAAFIRSIHVGPAIAETKFPSSRWLIDRCSFATLEKVSNFRRHIGRILRFRRAQ